MHLLTTFDCAGLDEEEGLLLDRFEASVESRPLGYHGYYGLALCAAKKGDTESLEHDGLSGIDGHFPERRLRGAARNARRVGAV